MIDKKTKGPGWRLSTRMGKLSTKTPRFQLKKKEGILKLIQVLVRRRRIVPLSARKK